MENPQTNQSPSPPKLTATTHTDQTFKTFIPTQLQSSDFRFIRTNGKIPIEPGWTTAKNYPFFGQEILSHLQKAETYGVATGFGNLVVIDIDNAQTAQTIEKENLLPPTFTVKTATKGLPHYYFLTDDPISWSIRDSQGASIADIQGSGKQAIGPLSIINGKRYEIVKDIPVSYLSMGEIRLIMSRFGESVQKEVKLKSPIPRGSDVLTESIRIIFTIPRLLAHYGISTTKNPTECPLHSSEKKKCLSFDKDVWYCHHCQQGGDVFKLLMKVENLDFPKAKNLLTHMAGLDQVASEIKKKESTNNTTEQSEQSSNQEEIIGQVTPWDYFNVKTFIQVKEYIEMQIEKLIIFQNKNETRYKFVNPEVSFIIELDDMVESNKFRKRYLSETGILLPHVIPNLWTKIINFWIKKYGKVEKNAELTNMDDIVVETILNVLQMFTSTTDIEKAAIYGKVFFDDKEPDYLYVLSANIDSALKKSNFKHSMGKLRVLMDDFVEGKSVVKKVNSHSTMRFWKFRKESLPGIVLHDIKKVKEEDDDNEEVD